MIRSILKRQNISLNKSQKIAGKLQHASFGMPGSQGIFSPIHQEMAGIPPFIIIKPSIKTFLRGLRSIITQLSTQPTLGLQLVQ